MSKSAELRKLNAFLVFFEILIGLYNTFLCDLTNRVIILIFLFESYGQLLLSVAYINVKIIRSKFKNKKNFTFFYPP